MIENQNDYQKTILDNLPFIAYLKDLNGKIIEGNSKLSKYCGIPQEKMAGLILSSIFEPFEYETIIKEDEYIVENKKTIIYERKLKLADREKEWYRVIKSPILNDKKEVTGITVFLFFIDSERKIEAKKETFVATLTHDLKTPTIAQIRIIELLLNDTCGKISDEQKDMLEQMLKSCKYMLSMISQVLNTYKFEYGQAKLTCEKLDLVKLTEECLPELINLADEKNLKLKVKVSAKDKIVYGDRIQLKRVLVNMIANSVSYAYKDTEIEIMIKEDEKMLSFYTINSSPYIPPDTMGRLFKKYVSNSSDAKYNKTGTGLGLYLSEKIITAHNGSIIAYSDKNNKNTFGFKIPKASCISNIQDSILTV